MSALLEVEGLSIALPKGADRQFAVEDVSFAVAENEIVCLVGESGSGKSMTAHAVLQLLPPRVAVASGAVRFRGEYVTRAAPERMRALRGGEIAMIFQEPLSALNPLTRVGAQVGEAIAVHDRTGLGREAIAARANELLGAVGLPDPPVIAKSYPFQLSGGQRQRVMIAAALANNPRLLLADEPTTALDVTTQRQILDLILALRAERRMGVLFITHDFGVVADIADRVVVMRQGQLVEQGPAAEVLGTPRHEYTRALIAAVPGHRPAGRRPAGEPLLRISGLQKIFVTRQSLFTPPRRVVAAADISLDVGAGETVALVGESGSGKSTLGRMVLRLVEPDGGEIRFDGVDVRSLRGAGLRQFRRDIQIVFQDPFASLNPRQTVGDAIARGPMAQGVPKAEARAAAAALLARVGLDPSAARRFPHEFSGGQRQRISIARALAMRPKLLVADEPVSALDVSIQAQVLELLAELRREFGLAMLFVTHDLRVAADIADRIAVMRHGRIVEQGPAADILARPASDYTAELLAAIPGKRFLPALVGVNEPHAN